MTISHDHPAVANEHSLGVGFMLAAMVSGQVGNSFAKRLTETMATPIGAVWMRLAFSGVILLLFALLRRAVIRHWAATRPEPAAADVTPGSDEAGTNLPYATTPARHPRQVWLMAVAYGAALVAMNSMFYEAIARIPVGIVITFEFLGPLTVAILGSRRPADFIWIGLAGLGMVILGVTPTPLSRAGVLLSLGAGVCWACYILLGARVAKHWQGVGVLTGTCLAGSVVLCPFFLAGGNAATISRPTIGLALVVALACTVLPYSLELLALGRLPTGLFAILESLAPAVGALAAWCLLGEALHLGDWAAIACVVGASLGATTTQARARRRLQIAR